MRSLLFVPAHDARKLAKALASGADALIVDLEDAVPAGEKPRARQMAADFVSQHRRQLPIFVRINALDSGLAADDLQAVVGARPHGVVLPKCGGASDVAALSRQLAEAEQAAGVAIGTLRILPIVTETAAAVFELGSYGRAPDLRLCGLFWGGEDLAADIGAAANRDAQRRYTAPYQLARALTLLGATAAQVPAIDAVYTDFRDAGGLQAEAAEALRDGFSAKVAIHPDQVGVINAVFTPATIDVERAHRIVAAFEAEPTAGAIALDGRMLDRPHLKSAMRVIARAAG